MHTAFIQIYQYFIGMKKLLLTFVLLTAVFATVFGDNVPSEKSYPVTGKVVDADTEEPLAGAMLKVEGTNIVVGTNSKGEFTITSVPTRFISSTSRAWVTPPERCVCHR